MSYLLTIINLVSFVWGLTAFCLLIFAWYSIRQGKIFIHKRIMIILVAGAWIFIATYLLKFWLPGYVPPEVPRHLIPWLALHGTLGLIPLFGATFLLWARLSNSHGMIGTHLNRHHRNYGRFLSLIWCFTHIGGLLNFWLF